MEELLMKITWIGQAGLLLQTGKTTVLIDPYLSDSVKAINPVNWRRVPVDESLFAVKPDVIAFTHCHLDHYDPETVERFIGADTGITVLAPSSVWGEVRKYGGNNNYVLFDRHTLWTQDDISFYAVKAQHSDLHAIGVVLNCGGKTYYVSGDTLYSTEIFPDLPENIDVAFLPINGLGNNMNMADAAAFAKKIGAKKVVPLHIGLFDELTADGFDCEGKVVPQFYKEISL